MILKLILLSYIASELSVKDALKSQKIKSKTNKITITNTHRRKLGWELKLVDPFFSCSLTASTAIVILLKPCVESFKKFSLTMYGNYSSFIAKGSYKARHFN